MARRRLLNAEAWNRLLMPPIEERDMVRHFTLSREDLALIRSRRTEATQLGFAMLLLYLRCPGRVLAAGETPPAPIIAFVARQLGVRRSAFTAYGRRDETRRKHLADLTTTFGYHAFGDATFGELVARLTPAAQIDRRPGRLGCVPIAATTRHLIQATQEGLDHGGIVLAERGAMGGY